MTQTAARAEARFTLGSMAERTVVVQINQQQEQMLDRLVAEGGLGETHADVIHTGFQRFCREHPELLGPSGDEAA
jgi:hypothetical protein